MTIKPPIPSTRPKAATALLSTDAEQLAMVATVPIARQRPAINLTFAFLVFPGCMASSQRRLSAGTGLLATVYPFSRYPRQHYFSLAPTGVFFAKDFFVAACQLPSDLRVFGFGPRLLRLSVGRFGLFICFPSRRQTPRQDSQKQVLQAAHSSLGICGRSAPWNATAKLSPFWRRRFAGRLLSGGWRRKR